MTQREGLHGASLMLVRQILDDFCEEHRMAISDRTAIEAARILIGLAVSEREEPMAMRQKVEEWFSHSQRNP
ncbi:hypothetical protein FY133_24630 (plasmid) [Agrobacterium tumefaciens]|uniref:Uncharacterized protein n=1 Tax=Agrobacterium tumefaciens TaxID=358 RepID=A0AAP9E9R8_AGRTU|nr:hypothetical protein [Agrobacterium tumefaciens]NSZ60020.1 hypothetical protein [Agrobacterium tumefaciens]NTZ64092.1 hypothetical protein [Agrobacterium tumefaciens]QDY97623.1 hypothetical protein CG010_026035 [Agrobacterium tumefaciens]UXS12748.1 hypothetical protein FY155_24180 [Agrobacterium tumefaciens]UXS20110.1 hypothetical protein FY154_24175 [Agrobacterium tumefaciens]